MKFTAKYPHAQPQEQPEACLLFVGSRPPASCWHCQDRTPFWDLDFGAPLCSEECREAKWQEFIAAGRASDPEVSAVLDTCCDRRPQ